MVIPTQTRRCHIHVHHSNIYLLKTAYITYGDFSFRLCLFLSTRKPAREPAIINKFSPTIINVTFHCFYVN